MLTWSAERAGLLAGDDAEAALTAALGRLSELGIHQHVEGSGAVWLEVSAAGRSLRLTSLGLLTDELRPSLDALLRLALQRAADQTERREVDERLALLSSASFEGILVHIDGVVIAVNQRLAEMIGCEPHELLGPDTMRRCIAPEDLAATIQRVASGFEGAYKITGLRWDGTRFPAELQS